MSFDWDMATHSILQWTNIAAECEAAGLRFAGPAGVKGWRPCYAIDRDESKPSAAICVESGNGSLGRYKDQGGGGLSLSLFDLLARLRPEFGGEWQRARAYLAAKAHVDIPHESNGSSRTQPLPPSTESTAPVGTASDQLIAAVCLEKRMPIAAARKFGAHVRDGAVHFPYFGPDAYQTRKPSSGFFIKPGCGDKGKNYTGKPTGLFLPGTTPEPGETWHIAEGVKDPAAIMPHLPDGHKIAGMNGSHLKKELAQMFKGCHVYLHAHLDQNNAGRNGRNKSTGELKGIAASIHFVDYPPALRDSGGSDARELLALPSGRELLVDAIKNAQLWNGSDPAADVSQPTEFTVIDSAEFAATEYDQRYLIRGILVAKQPAIVGGKSKSMKTSILIDLALSLGTGSPFLREFQSHRSTVGIFSGESGPFTLQETARRVAVSKNIDLAAASIYWSFQLPQLGRPPDLLGLKKVTTEKKLDVLILDPGYLMLLAGDTKGLQASNLLDMGPLLLQLAEVGAVTGSTIILCHHCRKNSEEKFAVPELEDLSMAGFGEWARQWLLLGRRDSYVQGSGQHRLWLNVGGSAGHSGCWALDIDEGQLAEDFSGRKWNVDVREAADERRSKREEAERRKTEAKTEQIEKHKAKVIDTLKNLPDGETARTLSNLCGLNAKNFGEVVEHLVKDRLVETCHVTKEGRRYGGYKLSKNYHRE